jgi:hypothetical protein
VPSSDRKFRSGPGAASAIPVSHMPPSKSYLNLGGAVQSSRLYLRSISNYINSGSISVAQRIDEEGRIRRLFVTNRLAVTTKYGRSRTGPPRYCVTPGAFFDGRIEFFTTKKPNFTQQGSRKRSSRDRRDRVGPTSILPPIINFSYAYRWISPDRLGNVITTSSLISSFFSCRCISLLFPRLFIIIIIIIFN